MESVSPYRVRPDRPAPPRRTHAWHAAAWRSPGVRRFDHLPANDVGANDSDGGVPPRLYLAAAVAEPELVVQRDDPVRLRWVVAVAGAVVAILLGMTAGGALVL